MIALLRSLYTHRQLLRGFIARDLKARYVGSAMGFFWSVIFPLLNLFVYMFVFRIVLKARWSDQMTESQTMLIMLAGILVWVSFAETISRGTNCLIEHANLIQKVVFPSEILAPFLTVSSLVNMMIGFPVVLVGALVLGEESNLSLGWNPHRISICLAFVPVLVFLQSIFTIGLTYILATLNLFLRDTYHVMGVLLMAWMFSTPIFYPASMVEKAGFTWVLDINPMYWLIESYRDVMLRESWPDWSRVGAFAAVAVVIFALGATFFMKQKSKIPDLL